MHANGRYRSSIIAAFLCVAGTAAFSECQPSGATDGTQSQIDVLSACIKASEAENAQLKEQVRKLEARLGALSVIVQDLVDDDGMAKVNNRINGLETRLGKPDTPTEQVQANVVPAIGGDLDTRAVVAFTSEKGERTCPPGWKPYEKAKDRFILGAGNKYQVVGSTGGEETVKLEERHMPSHRHGLAYLTIRGDVRFTDGGLGSSIPYADVPPERSFGRSQVSHYGPEDGTLPTGVDEPHNNMPPWIALYYCIKE